MSVTLGMVDWGVGGLGFYKELKKRVDARLELAMSLP